MSDTGGDENRFAAGQVVVRRIVAPDGRLATLQSARVVHDDDRGLLLWVGHGAGTVRRTTVDGETTRHLPYLTELHLPTVLQPGRTTMQTLILTPPGAAHSVTWWFAEGGTHTAWYVNLEAPAVRWAGGIDVRDHALDVIVWPDYTAEFKDEDEFDRRTGQPMFWDEAGAAAIRAEAAAVLEQVAAKEYPFDGTWCDYVPPAHWTPADLPRWWDQPPACPVQAWGADYFDSAAG